MLQGLSGREYFYIIIRPYEKSFSNGKISGLTNVVVMVVDVFLM